MLTEYDSSKLDLELLELLQWKEKKEHVTCHGSVLIAVRCQFLEPTRLYRCRKVVMDMIEMLFQ